MNGLTTSAPDYTLKSFSGAALCNPTIRKVVRISRFAGKMGTGPCPSYPCGCEYDDKGGVNDDWGCGGDRNEPCKCDPECRHHDDD